MRTLKLDDPRGQRYLDRVSARGDRLLGEEAVARAEEVVREVRRRGDAALLKRLRSHDLAGVAGREIRLGAPGAAPESEIGEELRNALDTAVDAVRRVHRAQLPAGSRIEHEGSSVAVRVAPVPSVGVVLAGVERIDLTALVMALVPARIAGVPRIAVAIPPRAWLGDPAVRYLLARLEVDEVYLLGGAHAAAALALGTETVDRTDLLVVGGDAGLLAAGVALARRVAVRLVSGPPELAVVADHTAEPEMVAADLLAQLEHDADALGLVVTSSARVASRTAARLKARARALPRGHVAREALKRWSAVLVAPDLEAACDAVDRVAPSRAELLVADPEPLLARLGAVALVSVGPWSAPALVDAVSGANHLLPTLGRAAARGPLSVWDFTRTTAVVTVAEHHYPKLARATAAITAAEGLPLHESSLAEGCRGGA